VTQTQIAMDFQVQLKAFLAGAAGGGTDSLFTMPFDTIKTQMQLNKDMGRSPFACARQIFRKDGIFGFYKGYLPFGIMAMGKASARWGSFAVFNNAVDAAGFDRTKSAPFWTFTGGLAAGTIEALCWTAPNERLKVLRQVSAGTNVRLISYTELSQRLALRDLWVGATPTAMRSATNGAIRFTIAGTLKDFYRGLFGIEPGDALPAYATFLAGGTGGAISTVLNNPVDVVKSKMQAGHAKDGIIACLRDVYSERGLKGFTAGISARVPQIFLSQAIQFVVVDKIHQLLK